MTDTGSMEPTPDAIAWSAKADAWAQRPATFPDSPDGLDVPANRWSEVATTDRPAFPPEGVGWRSETAEWRSSIEPGTWRTTTEWRSSEGNSGWRKTTEAWQTGGKGEGARPPMEPLTRQPAISGTAWPTPSSDEQPWSTQAAPVPPWQQQPDPAQSWQHQEPEANPSWQTPAEPTPSWQTPAEPTPSWQTRAEPTPSWQTRAEPTPSWQQGQSTGQSRQQGPDASPPWQQGQSTGQSWQQGQSTPSWQQGPEANPPWQQESRPSWQTPAPAGPARQQPADSKPSWQQPSADPTPSWQSGEAPQYWQQAGARPTDPRPPVDTRPAWQSEPERRPSDSRSSWQSAIAPTPAERPRDTPADPYGGAWSTTGAYDDGRHLVREDDRAQWRRESAAGMHDEASRRVGRRRAPELDQTRGGGTGWTVRSDSDNWAGHTDTGNMPLYQDPAGRGESSWRREATDTASWRRDQAESDPSDSRRARPGSRRAEPDSGSWAREDEGRTDTGSWRRSASQPEASTWRSAPPAPGDSGTWRRDATPEAASDPWAGRMADTGAGDWQPASDTGSWRNAPDPDDDWQATTDRPRGRRRAAQFDEPEDRGAGPRSAPYDEPERPRRQQTPQEVRRELPEPGAWRREQADRGAASYREGHTESWRRELAAETSATAEDARRSGAPAFPPFRPTGTAASGRGASGATGSASVTARRAPVADSVGDPRRREDLLVGSRPGGGGRTNWQGPPDTQWPPRGSTDGYQPSGVAVAGPYERRPISSMPEPSARQLLDEPDDDLEETTGGPLAAVGFTAFWYGVPVVLFVLSMLFLDGTQQSHALTTLAEAIPQFGLSLVLSMAVAVGLRRASGTWKAASVGLAAAVVGGGLATVLMSAVTGQSLS